MNFKKLTARMAVTTSHNDGLWDILTDSDKHRIGAAIKGKPLYREWVKSVMTVFASRLMVSYSQAVHAFETNRVGSLRKEHHRRLEAVNTALSALPERKTYGELETERRLLKERRALRTFVNMDTIDFRASARHALSTALLVGMEETI